MTVATEPSDSELMARMAAGDRDALAVVFRRHQGTVFRFSRQMLGSTEAAEDVTQDVFVALARNAGRFNPSMASLPTYLYGIARHLVLQRYKRSRSRIEINIDEAGSESGAALSVAADPADAISRAQMARQLRLAILRLPLRYREAIVLCELNGLSYDEAAAVAGCPTGTIRSRLSRARQMLVDRCRASWTGKTDDGRQQSAGPGIGKRWLILTKNNC